MQLTAILLLGFCLHLSATTSSQTVTYSGKNQNLESVLVAVEKQTGFVALFEASTITKARKVTISGNDVPLTDFLDLVFKNQPLNYYIKNNSIIVSLKEAPPSISAETLGQEQPPPVRGFVHGPDGQPLAGANVIVKGTKKGTTTDASGLFNIDAGENDILVISSIGFKSREIKIENQRLINAVLEISSSPLDEIQIIGYGSTSRRFSVGAVTTVTSEQIERQPVTNVLLALQGQVPGLTITPTNGAPGSSVKVQIRGQNTLSKTANRFAQRPLDQPLFIIDGVPFAAQNNSLGHLLTYDITAFQQSPIPGNGVSAFNNINPADIESISVLRDADATSIYGSQGANGVILITTKRGKQAKPTFNVRAGSGVNIPTRPLEMMNSEQYLAMRHESLAASGVVLTDANKRFHPDLAYFDTTGRSVDWFKEFFNKNSGFTDVHASLSGGQQNSSFFLSAGYTSNRYNFPGDFKDDRISIHSSYTYRSQNNKLSVQFGADYSYGKNNASSQPMVVAAMTMAPNYPALLDENGDLVWRYNGYAISDLQQYARLRQPAYVQSHNLNDFLRISYQVIPGLSVGALAGYSRTNGRRYTARPFAAQDPLAQFGRVAQASFENSVFETLNIEPQIDYKRSIGSGELSLLVGGTYRKSLSSSDYLSGSGYSNDDLLGSIAGASSIQASNSNSIYKYTAAFARANYIHNRKYIVSLSGRRDGSSNFGPGKQFGNFGSAGLGWIFSEESGFQNALPFISFGKLSANYGTIGSDGVEQYSYQAFYSVDGSYNAFQGVRPYTPGNLFNPDYSWGIKKAWNVGLELGFLNDHLVTNLNWYRNRMSEQLIAYTLPAISGFNSVVGNFPATVQNSGLELTIRSTNIRRQNFTWTTNFNISTNKNKLVAFPGLETSPYSNIYVIGESTSLVNGYLYKGLNPTTGLFEFYKKDGTASSSPIDNHINSNGDRRPLFDTDPKFSGGIDNTLTYKGFTVSLFLQFSQIKTKTYLAGLYAFSPVGGMYNLPAAVADKWWKKPGDVTEMQKLATSFGATATAASAYANSDAAYTNAYYVRVKTLALSWALPAAFIKRLGIKDCRLNINAQNLFTITDYELGDPEMAGSIYNFPLQRTITGGLSVNF